MLSIYWTSKIQACAKADIASIFYILRVENRRFFSHAVVLPFCFQFGFCSDLLMAKKVNKMFGPQLNKNTKKVPYFLVYCHDCGDVWRLCFIRVLGEAELLCQSHVYTSFVIIGQHQIIDGNNCLIHLRTTANHLNPINCLFNFVICMKMNCFFF